MAFLLSTLEIKGSDPRILILDQYFQKPFYEKPLTIQTGSFLQYVSTVSLFGEAMDESDGVSLTLDWLAENREKMRSLVGRAAPWGQCCLAGERNLASGMGTLNFEQAEWGHSTLQEGKCYNSIRNGIPGRMASLGRH